MRAIGIKLTGPVRWRISRDTPQTYSLRAYPELAFINPLCYSAIYRLHDVPGLGDFFYLPIALLNDEVILETNALLAICPQETDDFASYRMMESLASLLPYLRQASKQTELSLRHMGGGEAISFGELPEAKFPSAQPGWSDLLPNYEIETSLTWNSLQVADIMLETKTLPIYGVFMLDAVQAFLDRDDRRAILYAALSLEIIAEIKLGQTSKKKYPKGIGTIEERYHYQALDQLRRSLRDENYPLYEAIAKLYRTRNKIVHEGTTQGDPNVLPMDEYGSLPALRSANAAFIWFGESSNEGVS